MINKWVFLLLFMGTGITGCSSGSAAEENLVVEEERAEAGGNLPVEESLEELTEENVFLRYDAVKSALARWNTAIDAHRTFDLEKLYAEKVRYYAKTTDRQSVLNQKNEWLKQHKFYAQQLGHIEVYYDDSDTLGLEFIAHFTKICIEKTKQTEVESFLHFRKFGKDWKIVEETDGPTEVHAAKKKPLQTLPNGSYEYYIGYWTDTRDMPQFAHDMVPYNSSLNFKIGEKGITGIYNDYSGTMRSSTYYFVKSGRIVDGILELNVIFSQSDDPQPEDFEGNEETETWRFKILENKALICLSKENPTLYSRTLRLLN